MIVNIHTQGEEEVRDTEARDRKEDPEASLERSQGEAARQDRGLPQEEPWQ